MTSAGDCSTGKWCSDFLALLDGSLISDVLRLTGGDSSRPAAFNLRLALTSSSLSSGDGSGGEIFLKVCKSSERSGSMNREDSLSEESQKVCREDGFRHRSRKHYPLEFAVAQIPRRVIIQAFPGDVYQANGIDILPCKSSFRGPRGRLNIPVKLLA